MISKLITRKNKKLTSLKSGRVYRRRKEYIKKLIKAN